MQADFAIFSAGCRTIPIYPTYPPDLIQYIVNDAGVKTLFVEDPAQLAKVLEVQGKMEGLEQIVVMHGYQGEPSSHIMTWDGLRRLGRDNLERLRSELADRVAAVGPEDIATIVYTSGTTGPPKGVVQTHGNHMGTLASAAKMSGIQDGDTHLLFLPLAHSFARLESFIGVHRGLTTAFAESIDKLRENLPEVKPHFICSVPRVFEKVYAGVLAKAEAGSPIKRRIFNWAVGVGREVSRRAAGAPAGPGRARPEAPHRPRARVRQAPRGPRRAPALRGLGRRPALQGDRRVLPRGGHPDPGGLRPHRDLSRRSRSTGWSTSSSARSGRRSPASRSRSRADGEILGRGPNIAKGYFKKPEATAEVFLADGWFATGDIGRLDEDGFLFITDRKKDLIVTAGGMNIAPQNIENLLKGDPFISQAMVYGDKRPYPVALLTLNPEELAKFARAQGILDTDPSSLARNPKVVERVSRIVEERNAELQSYAKVKKFMILPGDFTVENGLLTPTLKVKRRIITDKHRELLDSLYR